MKKKLNYKQVVSEEKEFPLLGVTLTVQKNIPFNKRLACASE